jgi:hypothetical protein
VALSSIAHVSPPAELFHILKAVIGVSQRRGQNKVVHVTPPSLWRGQGLGGGPNMPAFDPSNDFGTMHSKIAPSSKFDRVPRFCIPQRPSNTRRRDTKGLPLVLVYTARGESLSPGIPITHHPHRYPAPPQTHTLGASPQPHTCSGASTLQWSRLQWGSGDGRGGVAPRAPTGVRCGSSPRGWTLTTPLCSSG